LRGPPRAGDRGPHAVPTRGRETAGVPRDAVVATRPGRRWRGMNSGPSIEERVREELGRMRGEIPATRAPGKSHLARARRGMAATLAGAILATAVVVGGSVVAWNVFGSTPTTAPAATGTGRASPGSDSAAVAELRSRPLVLPTLPPGGTCPATTSVTIRPGPGTGFTGTTSAQRAGAVSLTMAGPHVRL